MYIYIHTYEGRRKGAGEGGREGKGRENRRGKPEEGEEGVSPKRGEVSPKRGRGGSPKRRPTCKFCVGSEGCKSAN